jgi:hypothetical protein
MKLQFIDSLKTKFYHPFGNYTYYSMIGGDVGFSNVESILQIKNPLFSHSFSAIGSLAYGSSMLTAIFDKQYVNGGSTTSMQWNDGSPSYIGDTLWHYFNDIQNYSLNISLTDTLGCFTQLNLNSLWVVSGTLLIEESESINSVNIFPNPARERLNFECSFDIENIDVFDTGGNLVFHSTYTKEIDISNLSSGNYTVKLSSSSLSVTKKIVKL